MVGTPEPRTALVVDDEPAVARLLATFLQRLGFVVTVSHGAEEAESLLRTGCWDLLVTDLHMSGNGQPDGLRLLSLSRDLSPTPRTLLVSGSLCADLSAIDAGADRFLAKPIRLGDLAVELGELFPDGLPAVAASAGGTSHA